MKALLITAERQGRLYPAPHYNVLFLIQTFLYPILLRILEEAPDHQNHDNTDGECADDAHRLDIVHRTLTKHKSNRKYDQ